jgi:hypothetical protein
VRDSVRRAFVPFTIPLEGVIPHLYQDVKGLVSCAIGNLVDPISLALPLPFVRLDGMPATKDEIIEEWNRVKNQPPDAFGRTAAQLGYRYAKPITRLRLTPIGIEQVVQTKLNEMDAFIARCFPDYESWPADAQLGTLSMSWACGPGIFSPSSGRAHWPKLTAALLAQDFLTAAVECFMPEERTISGLRPRNLANRVLFNNAAIALTMRDQDLLYYPTDLASFPVDRDAQTQPDLVPLAEEEPPPSPTRMYRSEDMAVIHPRVPLSRPALDDPPPDDEGPKDAA